MDQFFQWLTVGNIIAPVMVFLMVAALFAVVKIVSRNYIKVAPNEVLVIYGRRYKTPDGKGMQGYRLVTGGAAFVIPLLEKCHILPTSAFQVKFSVTKVPSEQGVRVTVNAVATLKVGSDHEMLNEAVKRFLDENLAGIQRFAQEVLEGGLRGVVATMTVEQLVKNRTEFGAKVQETVTGDLQKLGLIVDNFLIQDISDEEGYIDALGRRQTAEVKRDAAIGEADAKRDENIRVAQAQKEADQKSSEARQAGEIAKAEAEKQISNAERERDTIKAQNEAAIAAERAKIAIAAEIAQAEKEKQLKVARVSAEEAEVEAQTKLEEKEQKRRDAELQATLIVQANREKEAAIVQAEGVKQSTIIKAEGDKQAIELGASAARTKREQEAEAAKLAAEREADGRKASAAAHQAELEAEARGDQARREAEAAGIKAKLMAEAEGIKAKLEAEAEGVRKKAEAYRQLDQSGKLLLILEHLPEVLHAMGEAVHQAGLGTVAPMAQAIGTGLSGIEEIRIVDLGGHGVSANGEAVPDALTRFVNNIPKTTFDILQQARALGLEPLIGQIAEKYGLDLDSILGEISKPSHPQTTPDVAITPVSAFNESESSEEQTALTPASTELQEPWIPGKRGKEGLEKE